MLYLFLFSFVTLMHETGDGGRAGHVPLMTQDFVSGTFLQK